MSNFDIKDLVSGIKTLASRYVTNHFIIGYFALFIIYEEFFIQLELLTRIILAIVASYVLFMPARLIVRDYYKKNEENFEAYTYYHFRIFFVLLFLALIGSIKLYSGVNFLQPIWRQLVVVFIGTVVADLITWKAYRMWWLK